MTLLRVVKYLILSAVIIHRTWDYVQTETQQTQLALLKETPPLENSLQHKTREDASLPPEPKQPMFNPDWKGIEISKNTIPTVKDREKRKARKTTDAVRCPKN